MAKKKFHKFLETAEATIFLRTNTLKLRKLKIGDRNTSVRLEPQIWRILQEVADQHGCKVNELCEEIYNRKGKDSSFTSAIRAFLISYLHIQTKKEL